MAYFIGLEGPGAGGMYPLSARDMNRIGRGDNCRIDIEADTFREVNVEVLWEGGQYRIRNANPRVEVSVNEALLEGDRVLEVGDSVRIADAVLMFADDDASAAADPTVSDSIGITVEEADVNLTVEGRQRYYENAQKLIEDLQQTSDPARYLGSFLKVTNALVSQIDVDQLLDQLLDIIFDVIPAERGTVFLLDPKEKIFRPVATKKSGVKQTAGTLMASRTLIREVLETKEGRLTRDAMSDDRFDVETSIFQQSIHSALCIPIVSRKEDVMGLVYVDTTTSGRTFSEDHLKLLTGIAMEAALAIENARLVEEVAEKKRLENELDIARTIQLNLVPSKAPECPGIEVAGLMIPAREVGGDYYDFVLSESDKNLYIAIGDVSGKGVPASLVMVMARCFFRPLIKRAVSTREIVNELNGLIYADTRDGTFMSMLVLAWDPEKQVLHWTGAGQEHLLIYRAATGEVERIKAGGLVLGLRGNAERFYKQNVLELATGDSVLLFTDGVSECVNPGGKMLGLDAVANLVARHGKESAEDAARGVLADLKAFMAGAKQHDDITLVTIRRP